VIVVLLAVTLVLGAYLYSYFEERIAEVQSLADKTKNIGEYDAYLELLREKRRRLFGKLQRRLPHLYRNFAFH
jgi:putative transposase